MQYTGVPISIPGLLLPEINWDQGIDEKLYPLKLATYTHLPTPNFNRGLAKPQTKTCVSNHILLFCMNVTNIIHSLAVQLISKLS